MLMFVIHLVGNLLIGASTFNKSLNETNWLIYYKSSDAGMFSKYLSAIYWAVVTLLAIGYGDILPKTAEEKIACSLCFIIGVGIMSFILSSSTN